MKAKQLLQKIWSGIKRIGFLIKYTYIRTVALIVKARRGDALEINPIVGKSAQIAFKIVLVISVLIFSAGAAFAIGIYKYKTIDPAIKFAARIIPFPAAIVQGRVVTVSKFIRNYQYIEKFYSQTQQTGVDMEDIKSKVLSQLIDDEILKSQAKKFGVSVKKSDVENAYSEVVVQNGGEEEVKKVLNDLYGLTTSEFKSLISDQILEQKLSEVVPIQVKSQHILIRVDSDAAEDKINEAKGRIDKVKAEIDGGLDFGEAAKKYSEDTGSNEQGGDLGFFPRGQMDTTFEDLAFASEVGKVSEPFRTEFGWHIIKVNERKGQIDRSFADWIADLEAESLILKILNV